jgi:hypothetical protein
VCTVETRLHVVRISDAREVVLRLRGQFGYAHAQLAGQALFYSYNERSGKVGHAGFLAHVSDLFRR